MAGRSTSSGLPVPCFSMGSHECGIFPRFNVGSRLKKKQKAIDRKREEQRTAVCTPAPAGSVTRTSGAPSSRSSSVPPEGRAVVHALASDGSTQRDRTRVRCGVACAVRTGLTPGTAGALRGGHAPAPGRGERPRASRDLESPISRSLPPPFSSLSCI